MAGAVAERSAATAGNLWASPLVGPLTELHREHTWATPRRINLSFMKGRVRGSSMGRHFTLSGAALVMTLLTSAQGQREHERDDALLERIFQIIDEAPDEQAPVEASPELVELKRTIA
jgi:hypothetical protein